MPIRVWQAVWRRLAAGVWALLLGLCLLADARANPQVQQMALERTAEGLYLNARLGLGATPDVEDALVRGVPLYFVWQADVTRSRWYWADKRLVSAVRVLRLAYQPQTDRDGRLTGAECLLRWRHGPALNADTARPGYRFYRYQHWLQSIHCRAAAIAAGWLILGSWQLLTRDC